MEKPDTQPRRDIAIGITGSFGSGASIVAATVAQVFKCTQYKLSAPIKCEFERINNRKAEPKDRSELQDIGNDLRQRHGNDYLADFILAKARGDHASNILIDGIRNTGEIKHLRRSVYDFFLISVLADRDSRFKRVVNKDRSITEDIFDTLDKRDSNEDLPHGQQVQLCIDSSDFVLNNSTNHPTEAAVMLALQEPLKRFLNVIQHEEARIPHTAEIIMHMAYSQSLVSQCIKRSVGALIIDDDQAYPFKVISTGYNENPVRVNPCSYKPGYCIKDSHVDRMIRELGISKCPRCGNDVKVEKQSKCSSCKTNVRLYFFQDHGMSYCTAIHAEVRAIRNAAGGAEGVVLYTTTFPCFQCSKEIVHSRIRKVVYCEPYPDTYSKDYLVNNKVELELFTGFKGSRFYELFHDTRMNPKTRMEE